MSKYAILLTYLPRILGWLSLFYKRDVQVINLFTRLLNTQQRVAKHRGVQGLIDWNKSTRLALLKYLEGNPINTSSVKLTKGGLPKSLGPLISIILDINNPAHFKVIRLVNTVLFSSRALKQKPNPDFNSIRAPYTGIPSDYLKVYGKDFWRALGYRPSLSIPRCLKWKKFHFTTKSGPNGHALATWITDFIGMPSKAWPWIMLLGGSKMETFILDFIKWYDKIVVFFGVKPSKGVRKLSYFSDKEGKTRVIGILDYLSQTVLKPLHLYLFRTLRKIPQDCSFNQGGFRDKIKDWDIFYSLDLSSATDRFPIDVISYTLESHLPSSYVSAWRNIMVSIPFKVDDLEISYSVGNPMGAYSSWTSFTLAHHYIFYYIARVEGIPYKTLKYVLLGDDVLIGDKKVAVRYLEIMKSLGVEIQLTKSHISPHFCEFAKRLIYKGVEVTPFPISSLTNTMKSTELLAALLVNEMDKEWEFQDVYMSVYEFLGRIRNLPSRVRKKGASKAYLISEIIFVVRGAKAAGEVMNNLARHLGFKLPPINDTVGTNILANIMVGLFADSQPEVGKGKPLGLLAQQYIMYITGIEEFYTDPSLEHLTKVPLTDAYGSIEQSYLDLTKKAKEIDTIGAGEWPILLRSMTIPLSDQLFVDRFEDTETRAIANIVKKLPESFQMIQDFPQMLDF